MAMEQYQKAMGEFNQAIEKDPKNAEFLKDRAQCYFEIKRYDAAIYDLDTALAVSPEDSMIYYKKGITFFANEKYKKCITTIKQALQLQMHMNYEADLFYHLGLAYCRTEKFEKSIFPYTKCVDKIPSDLRFIHERAKAYQMIDMHQEAVNDFNVVIKKNPKNAHAYFRRAFSLKALKRYPEAAEDFESAKNLDPMNPKLVVNYKQLKNVGCIVLCEPGDEKIFE